MPDGLFWEFDGLLLSYCIVPWIVSKFAKIDHLIYHYVYKQRRRRISLSFSRNTSHMMQILM